MTTQIAPRGRRRTPLTRDGVLLAALELADEGGLDALSMRSLGQRLGVEAMSLYRHVRNKEELLDGLVDIVFGEIDPPNVTLDWRAAMRERAISARKALARHPWAIGLMESRTTPGPLTLRHHDAVLGILLRAGFSSALATRAYNLVDSFIYGFALQERGLPFSSPEELAEIGSTMLEQMPSDSYPNLRAVVADLIASRFTYADEFESGLDLILDGLQRVREGV